MAHVAAYAAVTEVLGDEFGLGVTLFFEGEEEAGSPTFRSFLEAHRELLRADVIVVADSSNWKVGIPALTTSLRGLVDGTIEVQVWTMRCIRACSAARCWTPPRCCPA